jgi:DNA-binding MarR family transcriptional regulator
MTNQNELTELSLSAWRGFVTAHATLVDLIDRQLMASQQLPLHWYDVLIELFEAPDQRLRLHELAAKVVLSRSGLTRLVDRLESAGFLRREAHPSDRRGAFAILTEAGREAVRHSWPVYAQGITTYFANHLSQEEAQTLTSVFARLLEAAAQKTET